MESASGETSRGVAIPNRAVDEPRPLRVVVVGAGVSGILAAIKLQERVQDLDITIYDKNEDLGGTWFENKYPGCACDIPAHSYQLSFESNVAWSQFYAGASEILDYWKRIALKYNVRQYMKFGHKVAEARWDDSEAKWNINVEDKSTKKTVHDKADVLITAIGVLNEWRWPDIPGLHSFKGTLLHSAGWDATFKPESKKIAVIGAGSSGIQIVPSIQPQAERIDHYVRGRTWIAPPLAANEVQTRTLGTGSNFRFTEEEIRAWREDPHLYLSYRRRLEEELQSGHELTMRGSAMQGGAREMFTALMKERLAQRPEVAEHLLPNFPPLCKRLTPGPGYLESLTKSNVEVIPNPIEKVTETGIVTKDGTIREVDAIVCATGFDTTHLNRFPIYGQGGVLLSEKWGKRADTYLSMTTDGFPNLFMSLGPNSGLGLGNLIIILEGMASYFAQCVEKLQTECVRTLMPSRRAVNNFTDFCDEYFKLTVYSEECSSWYKVGGKNGRVTALWPGSSLHAVAALKKPRWEDFEFTYVDGNEFGWFGNGWSQRDTTNLDKAYYLQEALLEENLLTAK